MDVALRLTFDPKLSFQRSLRRTILFDGSDETAGAGNRGQWRSLKAAGHGITY